MQRFALFHDGSTQGWRTAYLAFHVAARLGAPLQVLLVESDTDKDTPAQMAAQIEIGGRAAGLSVETRIVTEFSVDTLISHSSAVNGLFIPHRLLPVAVAGPRLLEDLSCPLWIVSEEAVFHKMAVIVENPAHDKHLISYSAMLAQRMNEPLTGLIAGESPSLTSLDSVNLPWMALQDLSTCSISSALDRLGVDLVFLRVTHIFLVSDLGCNCVIYPEKGNA